MTKRTEKPWGYEQLWALTDGYAGKVLCINAGEALSLQYHEVKEETILIIQGSMDLEIEENGEMVKARMCVGDSRHIPPMTKHRMIAVESCLIAEVSTHQLDDVVRLEDRYGRIEHG